MQKKIKTERFGICFVSFTWERYADTHTHTMIDLT